MLQLIKARLDAILQHSFFRKNLFTLVARLAGLGMQLGYFILLARSLKIEEYGLFIGIAAMASLLISFAGFGSGDLLVKNVSRDRELFRDYWGNALLTTLIASSILIVACLIVAHTFFAVHTSVLTIFLILLSDILCLTLWNLCGHAFAALDLLYKVAQLDIVYSSGKLVAAVVLSLQVWPPTIDTWAWLYCSSSVVTAIISIVSVIHAAGRPTLKPDLILHNLKEGIYFSLSYSAEKINGDIDKSMLASMATLEATGLYAAGSRFLTAAYTPLQVLFGNCYMRYFKYGHEGIRGSFSFGKRLLPAVLAYGLLTTTGFAFLAQLVPYVLGESYRNTVMVLHWLSPYILILGVQAIAADTLTGAGFQSLRSSVNVGAALINIGFNLWLIPLYSWRGAIWATLISDGSKLIVLWLIVWALSRQQQRYAPESST
ncbi:MAG: oligosaccharide flippase family protein [Synechococcales cyanobacterium CRU_2_2]|nr:oligosaccharide flippase family protein [Synechococcales cyanobacterium CRU_2_2]